MVLVCFTANPTIIILLHELFIMQLMKAHEELNKRIFEHDRNMATEAVKTDITLAVSSGYSHTDELYHVGI